MCAMRSLAIVISIVQSLFLFKLRLGASRTRSVGWSVGLLVGLLVGLSVLLGY